MGPSSTRFGGGLVFATMDCNEPWVLQLCICRLHFAKLNYDAEMRNLEWNIVIGITRDSDENIGISEVLPLFRSYLSLLLNKISILNNV